MLVSNIFLRVLVGLRVLLRFNNTAFRIRGTLLSWNKSRV